MCVCVYVERMKQPREEMKGSITLNLLVLLYFCEQFVSSSCLFFHTTEDFFFTSILGQINENRIKMDCLVKIWDSCVLPVYLGLINGYTVLKHYS